MFKIPASQETRWYDPIFSLRDHLPSKGRVYQKIKDCVSLTIKGSLLTLFAVAIKEIVNYASEPMSSSSTQTWGVTPYNTTSAVTVYNTTSTVVSYDANALAQTVHDLALGFLGVVFNPLALIAASHTQNRVSQTQFSPTFDLSQTDRHNQMVMSNIDLYYLNKKQGFKILGAGAHNYTGSSVSGVGDINGDGIDDIMVGSSGTSQYYLDWGYSYVIYGKKSSFENVDLMDFNNSLGFKISHTNSFVNKAGDVNGDGIQDMIVGLVDPNTPNGITFCVIYGRKGEFSDINLENLNNTQGFKIFNNYGVTAAKAGDVNQDGVDDIIIGAPLATPLNRLQAGITYVIYGKKGGLEDINCTTLNGTQGFQIFGENANDSFGSDVNGAGDVNNDGIDDMIAGAGQASPFGRNYVGEAYVIYGKKGGLTNIDLINLSQNQGFRIFGGASTYSFGSSVAGVGDVNADRIDDIIISSFGLTGGFGTITPGSSYVIYGKDGGLIDLDLDNFNSPAQGFIITDLDDDIGFINANAGDVNGDGINDMMIGVPSASPLGRVETGAAFVVYGKKGGLNNVVLDSYGKFTDYKTEFGIFGEYTNGGTGASVSQAGDINGDGIADIVIGSPTAFPLGRTNAGEAYVIYGTHSLPPSSPPGSSHTLAIALGACGGAVGAGLLAFGGYRLYKRYRLDPDKQLKDPLVDD